MGLSRGRQATQTPYHAWHAACRRAGIAERRIFHDLRRTGARAFRALGLTDRDIYQLCGWDEDCRMVSRYLGRDSADVAERLTAKMAESDGKSRTKHDTFGAVGGFGE